MEDLSSHLPPAAAPQPSSELGDSVMGRAEAEAGSASPLKVGEERVLDQMVRRQDSGSPQDTSSASKGAPPGLHNTGSLSSSYASTEHEDEELSPPLQSCFSFDVGMGKEEDQKLDDGRGNLALAALMEYSGSKVPTATASTADVSGSGSNSSETDSGGPLGAVYQIPSFLCEGNSGVMEVMKCLCDVHYVPQKPWDANPANDYVFCQFISEIVNAFGGSTLVTKLKHQMKKRTRESVRIGPLKALLLAYPQYFDVDRNMSVVTLRSPHQSAFSPVGADK